MASLSKDALQLALRADPEHRRAEKQLQEIRENERIHSNWRDPWRADSKLLFVETNTNEAQLWYSCDSVTAFFRTFAKVFNVRNDPLETWGNQIGVKIRDQIDRLLTSGAE